MSSGVESEGASAQSLQKRMISMLTGSELQLNVLVEPHYSGGRVGDEILREIIRAKGIEPLSSTLFHIYPTESCNSWEEYQRLCSDTSALLIPLSEPGVTINPLSPVPEYDSEDLNSPADLKLGVIEVLEHPLPSFFSLTTVIVHPTEDVARRFMAAADDSEAIDAYETIITAHELPFLLPPAPESLRESTINKSSRRGWKAIARRFAGWLNKVSES